MTQDATAGPAETGQPAPTGFIDDPHDLGNRILRWKEQGFHVLSPAIQISHFASGYGVNASLVMLDPNVADGGSGIDVYFDKNTMNGKGDNRDGAEQRAPSKIGLLKIAAAAGVSWVEPYGRVDDLTIQNLWIYRVTGVYLAYDGTPQVIKGEKEIDYRDGSSQIGEWSRAEWREIEERNRKLKSQERQTHINGWSDRRVRMARTNGAERAETGALTRAIRTLGIKHVFTIAELKKPFVALRVCPMVDMSDPDVRREVTAGMLGGVAKLYAHVQPSQQHERQTYRIEAPRETIDVEALRESFREPETVPARREGPAQQHATVTPPVQTQAQPPQQVAAPVSQPQQIDPNADDAEHEPDLPAGAVWLKDVRKEHVPYSRNHQKFGEKFTKWFVTDHNGEESETIFGKWGSIIDRAYYEGLPVFLQTVGKTFRGTVTQEIQNVKIATGEEDVPLPLDSEMPKL